MPQLCSEQRSGTLTTPPMACSVLQDTLTGLCLAPNTPGQLGRPIKVLTNHLPISSNSTPHTYRVTFSPTTPPSSSTASAPTGTPDPPSNLSLDSRQQLMTQLAGQQGWAEGSWQYDPSSNMLFSNKQGLLGPTGSLQATLSAPSISSSKSKGKQGRQLWAVSVTPQGSVASQEADTLQLLGLLTSAMLVAAVERLKGVISGRGSGLLPPGVLGSSPSSAGGVSGGGAGGRGGGRGRRADGRAGGRGRSGGRAPGASALRSNFPAVLQVGACAFDPASAVLKAHTTSVLMCIRTVASGRCEQMCKSRMAHRLLQQSVSVCKACQHQPWGPRHAPPPEIVQGLSGMSNLGCYSH